MDAVVGLQAIVGADERDPHTADGLFSIGGLMEIFAANCKLSLMFLARWLGTLGTDNLTGF